MMDGMDLMDPEGEALPLVREADEWRPGSSPLLLLSSSPLLLLSPYSSLLSPISRSSAAETRLRARP
jgi:hypothetical protein